MAIQVCEVGDEGRRVVIIDDFLAQADADALVQQAATMAPFPEIETNYYPGLRRMILPEDGMAYAYVDLACEALAPIVREIYGVERFRVTEASFSLATLAARDTRLAQRVPHYDSFDANDFAVLHYLNRSEMGGTAFYRHRRSGFETLDATRAESFQSQLDQDMAMFGPPEPAYINETTQAWEKIGEVPWRFNRLLIYQGSLFHSGLIPDDFAFSPDPRHGRLTANIFLHAMKTAART